MAKASTRLAPPGAPGIRDDLHVFAGIGFFHVVWYAANRRW